MRLSRTALATAVLVPLWSAVLMRPLANSNQQAPQAATTPPAESPVPVQLPLGVSPTLYAIAVPPGKEPRADRVRLGEKLFREKRLSSDNTVACADCHIPEKGFVDGQRVSDGVNKSLGQRNSPTVLNAMFNASQFWDGRAATLEDQAKLPILNPIEMGMTSAEQVVRKLKGFPEYVQLFRAAFGRDITYDDLASAIAAFERTQFSGQAPFDRFIQGDAKAISASARRGWNLFNGIGRCNECHAADAVSPLFSDQKFHNIGIAAHKTNFAALATEALKVVRTGDQQQIDELAIGTKFSELGRFLVTKNENEIGAFKTSNLRNIGITAPYMHDGSLKTLWDVMDHYNKGGVPNPFLDGGMQRLGLTESEIDDLVALMFSLTDQRFAALNQRELQRQRAGKNVRPERDTAVAMGKRGNLGDLAPRPDRKEPADLGWYGRYPRDDKTDEKTKDKNTKDAKTKDERTP